MQFKHDGMSLWIGTPDAPAPMEKVLSKESEIAIIIGVQPVDTSNQVEIIYRVNGGPLKKIHARWLRNDEIKQAQYFMATFPAFNPGDKVEYTVVGRCAGKQVPSAEESQKLVTHFHILDVGAQKELNCGCVSLETCSSELDVADDENQNQEKISHISKTTEPLTKTQSFQQLELKNTEQFKELPSEHEKTQSSLQQVQIQLVNQMTGEPLRDYSVRITNIEAHEEHADLGKHVTDFMGRFTLPLELFHKQALQGANIANRVQLDIVDSTGNHVYKTKVYVDKTRSGTIRLAVPNIDESHPPIRTEVIKPGKQQERVALQHSNRIRVFVVDEATGKPLSNVPVIAVAEMKKENSNELEQVPLGLLASDHVGYLSFDISQFIKEQNLENIKHVWIYPLHQKDIKFDALPSLKRLIDPLIVPLRPNLPLPKGLPDVKLPSMQCPDQMDWRVSPRSFGAEEAAIIGESGCEVILPSGAIERSFKFSQLVREPNSCPSTIHEADLCDCEDSNQEFRKKLCYRIGALIEYEMVWQPVGHGLGKIIYSLPLAPCESVKLAIIDWARQDDLNRGEDTGIAEHLLHSQRRDRNIDEVVDASLTEWQRGNSFMGGTAGAGGYGAGTWGVFGTHALGTSSATTRGGRHVTADTSQKLADAISQASSSLRKLNSTVIVQASQLERDRVETRTVTNHNHCHAMTVLYYEVVRHYCVSIRLANKQDVIFIKRHGLPPITFSIDNLKDILCYRSILEQVLIDKKLQKCFDSVEKLYCEQFEFNESSVSIPPDDYELEKLEVIFKAGSFELPATHDKDHLKFEVLTKAENVIGFKNSVFPVWGVDESISKNEEYIRTFIPTSRVRWGNVKKIRISLLGGGRGSPPPSKDWELAHLKVTTTSPDGYYWILFDQEVNLLFSNKEDTGYVHEFMVKKPGPPRTPDLLLTKEERCCVQKLIDHLNCNKSYYNRAIWMMEDPDARAKLFDQFCFQIRDDTGRVQTGRLIDFIENRAISVSGDYVAYPLLSSEFADTIPGEVGEILQERIISLPTRGAFAEAKLAHCNSCEEKDITRYWDWRESPCPQAPDISDIRPGSRAREFLQALQPSSMPSNLGIQQPPPAPEPTAMQKVIELLSTPDIFRDLSGSGELGALLGKLVEGAVDMQKSAIQNAAEIEKKELELKAAQQKAKESARQDNGAESTPGKGELVDGQTQTQAKETLENSQVIESARKKGFIDRDKANRLQEKNLERMVSGGEKPKETPSPRKYAAIGMIITEVNTPVVTDLTGEDVDVVVTGRLRGIYGIGLDPNDSTKEVPLGNERYSFVFRGKGRVIGGVVSTHTTSEKISNASPPISLPDDLENADAQVRLLAGGAGGMSFRIDEYGLTFNFLIGGAALGTIESAIGKMTLSPLPPRERDSDPL